MPDALETKYYVDIIQQILNKTFDDPEKRIIIPKPNFQNCESINFACPSCGDSQKRRNVKRAYFFFKNGYVKCWNSDECSASFTKYVEKFGVKLDPEKKIALYDHISTNFSYTKKDDFTMENLDKLMPINEFFDFTNKHNTFLSSAEPIVNGSIVHNYLISRKIFNYDRIWQGLYNFSPTWKEPVIIMMNTVEDKLISFSLRNLKSQKEKRFYKFYQFENIYNMLHPEDKLDEIEAISYNKLSMVFNFLNIDLEQPIYLHEGYLDSLFFPNSIALVGLETDISFLKGENLDLRFVLDNDGPGEKKAKKMLEEGSPIFLWKKLFKDMSKGKGGPKLEHWLNENIKDVNKLAEYCDNANIYNDLKLDSYFARDKFDLIDL